MSDERAPYVDQKVPKRLVPLARQSLRMVLEPGEEIYGMFSVVRFRRSISLLVVTDRRLLTLGDEHVGLPLVDEVPRADVREVTIERDKVWTAGLVKAHTVHGEEVSLGSLNYNNSSTFLRLDEVLARPTAASLPTIPTPGLGARPGREDIEDLRDLPATAGRETAEHPLIAQLTALADLYDRGALTGEEFTAAKGRLLAGPEASASS